MDSAAKETPKEVLMPLGQRALVDTCFEEGHYESGIAVLDKLRSPKYYPSPSHVRQLIYIALYPPPLENAQTPDDLTSGSPKKLNIQRQKTHLLPTPESSVNALSLLCALLHTNSPAALAKGLPSYVTSKGGVRFSGVREEQDDREDAFIGKQSADIRQAKDCWAILADGFVKRSDSEDVAEQPPTEDEMDVDEEEDENTARRVVGKHAWGVLEWLVGLFELDEKVAESKGMPRRSDILLSQIPLARAGLQWDIQSALNVVFDALTPLPLARHDGNGIPSATPPILEQYRTGLGTRLMALVRTYSLFLISTFMAQVYYSPTTQS
ncbi:hypothetical protein BOTBODRAFT_201950 [Botryobasidium botryosum FD-172 SS1]|uniref:Uncharacterized protein n=1 Tax=Botryobasidium botryosum (strain FD-172 SS1) TaxID=930990 RepID=A0A067N097_BOTB1|nr:hypothetical protein BOTBODRAFT_201950 [Botryobasidium botryosum FD-172 SS1]